MSVLRDLGVEEGAGATRVRIFRLVILLAQELRTLMDKLLREDGLTTQQAALLTVIGISNAPSLTEAATMLGTTHQNVKQLASSLERKGFVRIVDDESDRRVRRLLATEKSDATWRRRSRSDQQRVLDWFSGLSDEQAESLFQLLLAAETGVRAQLEAGPDQR